MAKNSLERSTLLFLTMDSQSVNNLLIVKEVECTENYSDKQFVPFQVDSYTFI